MIRLGYKYKLLLSFTGIFAVFAVVMVLFEMHYERGLRIGDFRNRMSDYADMVGREISQSGGVLDSARMKMFLQCLPSELRFTVIDRKGYVVYESGNMNGRVEGNHANRPEVSNAMKVKTGSYDVRHSETLDTDFFYFAKAYGNYVVRVARPYDEGVRNILRPANVFLLFVLLVLPIAIVILIYISDSFGRSVSRLRRFIDEAGKGGIGYDEISFPHSELGDIGREIMNLYRKLDEKGRQAKTERERLLKHFQYLEGGIAIFNTEKGIVYANPRFVQYVNSILPVPTGDVNTIWANDAFRPVSEFVGLNSRELSPGETAPVMRFNISAGSARYAVQVVVYNSSDFEMTLYDVTRAEKSRILKQQMSNNITHELRTPVSSIRGYIETILECKGLSDDRKRYFLERAHTQVIRLSELIRDVAIITKVEEAPETMHKETLMPCEIVNDVIEELDSKIKDADMQVYNRIDPEIKIFGNYSLVYSIFRNLVENSVRYAGRGTEVCVECYNSDDDFCYFNFYDTGKGCPEEHLPRLFERFYRAEEGRTRELGGSGLGLSIVRNAVTFHHGNISVRNRKEGGLRFLFTLQRHEMK